jgi:ankyrin repeat protein
MSSNIQQICCDNIVYAASEGHLDCIKYLYSKGFSLRTWAIAYAAENGHLDCLKYLIANGCPFDTVSRIHAAKHGHLDCLKYLIANGHLNYIMKSFYFYDIVHYIVRYGHKDVLKYYINENFINENFINNLDGLFIKLDEYPTIIDLDDK